MLLELSRIDRSMAAQYGNKAACLGELLHAGVPVPPGYVLSIDDFNTFLKHNSIDFNPDRFLGENDLLQNQLMSGVFPQKLKQDLEGVYNLLHIKQGKNLIVRSSAICEDASQLSFAGMFDSILKVDSPEKLYEVVKKCYASLLSDKVLDYVLTHGVPLDRLLMGVLIQQYIPGYPSGVLFTVDTIKMDPGVMAINWVDGPCSLFMEGTGKVKQLKVNKKGNPLENTGGLRSGQVDSLVQLGNICEELFGNPQDIEWTFAGETLVALQSRPVTTFKDTYFPVSWEDPKDMEYTWYKVTGPEFPLEQERYIACQSALNEGAGKSGLDYFYTAVTCQNGCFYWRRKELPGAEAIREKYNSYVDGLKKKGLNIFSDIYLPRIVKLHKEAEPYLNKRLSNTELISFLDVSFRLMKEINYMHWLVVQGCLEEDIILIFREKYQLKSHETSLLLHQPTWLTINQSTIMRMVQTVKGDPELYSIFTSHTCARVIYAHLARIPKASGLLTMIDNFLKDYGLYQLGWNDTRILRECPWEVAGYIRNLLGRDTDAFFKHGEKLSAGQKVLLDTLPARLGPEKWEQLKKDLPYYKKAYLVRDNHAHYIDATAGGFFRMACILTGKRLQEQGKICQGNDYQFLFLKELKQLLACEEFDPKPIISKRRKIRKKQQALFAPPRIGMEPQVYNENSGIIEKRMKEKVLKGNSGLAAVVKAEIRLKKDLPVIDNGTYIFVFGHVREMDFTSILPNIAGLVFEWGSPFDHVGIWARENNIPALFGIKQATALLASGDVVELDGIEEELRIISRKQ